jgi:membrane associated rhomboid family serine protease
MLDDRKLMRPLRVAVVISFVVMIAATFAPFATQGCAFSCPASLDGAPFIFPSVSLFQSLDGWIVLCVVVTGALVATASLVEFRPRLTACASLVAAVGALALCIFDGIDAWGRVMGGDAQSPPMEMTPHGPVPYVPAFVLNPPVHVDVGFSVFIAAAVVAAIAALLLVGIVDRDQPLTRRPAASALQGRNPAPAPN